jgi:hypothetical protein
VRLRGVSASQAAQQLDFEDNFEIIRLLGKAARQLTKKEYADSLIEALQLLTFAYRSAGLLWAAGYMHFAMASMFIGRGGRDLSLRSYPWLWPSLGLLSNFGIFQTLSKLFG